MKKLLPLAAIVSFVLTGVTRVEAQTIWAGNDTSICPGQTATLTAHLINPWGGPITTPTDAVLCGSTTGFCDDSYGPVVNLGFTFNFFGTNYTQCVIGSNSVITFALGNANNYCPWPISANCPSAANPTNSIMFPWQDNVTVRPPGKVWYKTIGVAPNRVFVVEFLDVQAFSCGSGNCYGNQVMLYETSNLIETHMFHKQACTGWNSGRGVHGIQNAAGTVAFIVPGRNGLDPPWYVNQPPYVAAPNSPGPEGRRWTPTGPSTYTISTIPFAPVYMPTTLPAPATITWSIAGGGNVGTGTTVNVAPASTTNYVVTIPMSGTCASLNFRDTVRVNMGQLPLTVSPNPTICFGDTATIYAHTTISGTVNFTWTPSGSLANPTSDTTQAFPTVQTVYTVTASNGGCTNSASVTVFVNALPIPAVNPVDPQICQGSSVNMTASGGTNYTWSPGTGLNTTSGATVNAAPTVTTPYTIVVTDANGCTDSIVNTVTFFTNPTVTANATTPGVCLTFSDQLQANGAVSYQWSPSNGLNYSNIATPVATPNATTNYQVIGTDANGCVDTAYVNVLVYPNPVAGFTAPVTSGCQPLTVNLQNTSTVSTGTVTSYIWNVETMGTSNAQNPSYTFTNFGNFDVSLVAVSDMGCTDTLTIVDYLHSYSVPIAGFNATPNPATLGDALISFDNTSTLDAVNFFWDFAGLGSSAGSDPQFEFAYADTFDVTLIVSTANGCSDTTDNIIIVEDVSEIWIPSSFTPGNQDGLNDAWFPVGRNLDKSSVGIQVEVFDRWGTSVFASNNVSKKWMGKISNTANDCPQGVYVYKVYFVNEKGKEFNYSGHITLIR